jgi:molybdopterin-dependent oxidoreductase alpha subunit
MGAIDSAALGDVSRLRNLEPERLRSLGRLAYPMVRRKGERGFLRVSWEEAADVIAREIRQVTPNQLAFLASGEGLTNEVYYVFQKLARALGSNNLDLCSGLCRMDGVAGLRATLGIGASTCSLSDLIGTDLLVLLGADLATGSTLSTQYLRRARKAGTRIVMVSSETGTPAAAVSRWADDLLRLKPDGESAYIAGVLKFLFHAERVDTSFIERHTWGFAELFSKLQTLTWNLLEQRSGVAREEMQRFAAAYSRARTAVFAYSESFAGGESGLSNVMAIVNLALARGMIGREKCGIMALRAQSGEQGAAECGAGPDCFPGGFPVGEETARRFSNLWHHPMPSRPGLGSLAMMRAAHEGRIKVLYALRGDSVESAPDGAAVAAAVSRVPVRVHQDIALSTTMLLDVPNTVVLLPGRTRYEQRSGGITTSTERRILFTPEISGRSIGESLPDWQIPTLIGRRTMSNGDKLFPFADTQAIREEMSRVMPIYLGVELMTKEGDQRQWGGPQLHKNGFTSMPQGRALFTALDPPLG